MATISVSNSGLSPTIEAAASLLLDNGYNTAGTPYSLTAIEASSKGITDPLLDTLLRNGIASVQGQKGIVNMYAIDSRTGEVGFTLNYNLTP